MKRNEIRLLGLGFLLSAIILSGYGLINPGNTTSNTAETVEETSAESSSEETSENSVAIDVVKDEETSTSESTAEESNESSSESELTEVTVTVNQGDTPDVVINDLVNAGIIEDGQTFYDYLNANGYDLLIKPGDHGINSNMGYYEIAQELMSN